ncbi:MAG: hypothetical protein ACRENS_02335 [Candidatus Eiseniibacteriota bacterium]
MPRSFARALALWIAMMALCAVPAAAQVAPAPAPSGSPTLAREDTLTTSVSEILVRAPRVTLNEILDRVARGEAHRDSMLRDAAFRVTFRILRKAKEASEPTLMREAVYQIYRKRPDRVRAVQLRDYREHPKKDDNMNLDFGSGFGEEIVNFAFRPEARRDFTYRIVGRDVIGGHLVYRIAFQPRSVLDPSMPSGLVWIDTNEFVIVRQEVSFERSPVPAMLKGVPRMVVERQRVGDLWMLSRVLLRVEMTFNIPRVGRFFDMAILFDDYHVNAGLPDSLFAKSHSRVTLN